MHSSNKLEYKEFATLEEIFRNFVMEWTKSDLRLISDAQILSLKKD